MKIFVIGQCTLHWGRLEFGNIGNYYIIEPFFRELHAVFPVEEIVTTFQLTKEFCERENVGVVPMNLFYNWDENDLPNALKELGIALLFEKTGRLFDVTPYIEEVISSDLVIDFSGDMWGDNADLAGKDRFLVGLLKDRTAQILGKPTVMLSGSPGPFSNQSLSLLAKEVFKNFSLVTNREKSSSELLAESEFELNNVVDLACPSILFEASTEEEIEPLIKNSLLHKQNGADYFVGFILCGWNFSEAPFSKFPREDCEYIGFLSVVEHIVKELGEGGTQVYLLSHSNGFEQSPNFKLIHGRDYLIAEKMYSLLPSEFKDRVILMNGIYSPAETKAIIRHFDMLVSGRLHGAVAGLSQSIPTVIIDYGHEPKAHKLNGYAQIFDMEEFVANPASSDDMIQKINKCWANKGQIKVKLDQKNSEVKLLAKKNFELLRDIV